MAHLEEPRAGFSDHDVVLHLLLGLVSGARRLEGVLPIPPAESCEAALPPLDDETERRVLLLLGLISVRRTVMRTLKPALDAMAASVSSEPSAREAEAPGLRELLR